MGSNSFDIPRDALSLEPLDAGPTAFAHASVPAPRAQFNADARAGRDRRVHADRRQEYRMTTDRRTGKDRRPRRSWEPGRNL